MLCTQYCRILAVSNTISLFFAVNAVISAHEKCTTDLFKSKGVIKSPNRTQLQDIFLHENHESNLTCRWIIYPQSGIIKLEFPKFKMGVKTAANECTNSVTLKMIDRSARSFGSPEEVRLCGVKSPPSYFSKGPMLEIKLMGNLLHPSFDNFSFEALYTTVTTVPTVQDKCDPCGGRLNRETGMIRSPRYPKNYPNNCDCKWIISVRKGYIVKLKFWAFSLEEMEGKICHDFLSINDGTSSDATLLGKYCGNESPGTIKTTNSYAFLYFHSDFSKASSGFEIMFESQRDEEDLTSLRSIAAILGGVSFGIFIFILLCSIVYKRYVGGDDRRNTCPPVNGDDDYLDAVQAAAPPSYQAVMADPDHYPRTPEVTPAASPAVTPILPRRNLIRPSPLHYDGTPHLESLEEDEWNGVETPPPPYPGNAAPSFEEEILIRDLPPPPTYEMVSDNEEHEESVPSWAPSDLRVEPTILATTEAHSSSSNNSESTSTQVTTCESSCCSSNGLVRLGTPSGDCRSSFTRLPHRDEVLCLRCIEESVPEVRIRRQRSDGSMHENYLLLRDDGHERSLRCPHTQPLRRRKSSYECGVNDDINANTDITCDKREAKWLQARKERCRSVPSLSQRSETAVHRRRNVFTNHSPLTIRSLFGRHNHNHNSNRVSPRNSSSNSHDSIRDSQPRTDTATANSVPSHDQQLQ
ncbi:uncharacterized protein LOC135695857 isoform X2 [Rhopilema esculentum]|uniref:uncharacterized protein LOC135695857 isoform X2 n=1 Tax=Rhopilema esculentum TaxID=499914 RepID=UPI0031D32DAC